MESAFGWLGEIFRSIIKLLIPGVALIHRTHGAVRFRRGEEPEELEPGFYFYWRVTTTIIKIPVVRDTINLTSKPLTTRDGLSLIMGVTVVFRVNGVLIALSEIWEIGEAIAEVAMTALPSRVLARSWDALIEDMKEPSLGELSPFEQELTAYTAIVLVGFGVEVEYCKVNSFAPATVIYVASENQTMVIPLPGGQLPSG